MQHGGISWYEGWLGFCFRQHNYQRTTCDSIKSEMQTANPALRSEYESQRSHSAIQGNPAANGCLSGAEQSYGQDPHRNERQRSGDTESASVGVTAGRHENRELQKDWNEFGSDAFEFETLDLLKPSTEPGYDPNRDHRELEQLWIEKLSPIDLYR